MECDKYITKIVDKTIVCVIEPEINQLLGSLILYQSIKANPDNHFDFNIKILEPFTPNPYLNKLEFTNDNSLNHLDILLLDWDIIHNPINTLVFPNIQEGELYARGNPTSCYLEIIESLTKEFPEKHGNLSKFNAEMSINTGVMFAKFETFKFMRERAKTLIIDNVISSIPEKWKQEQFILSLITKELKLNLLENHWNYTPLSDKMNDKNIIFWHYNDGDNRTYRLKRNLLHKKRTAMYLHGLTNEWKTFKNEFEVLYYKSINNGCFRIFQQSN